MERSEQLSFPEPVAAGVPTDLAPLNIIRTETVLSRMPVHNLAKRGEVDIQIVRKNESGAVELRWMVSHSDRYGQPRQLAYKLDTLIVNRRIDELGRPLPKTIRMGSLKEIARELGMIESGKNSTDLRLAFLQNASSFINAQLTYRGVDMTERRLEAGFTRYGVVFTGEKLPDGRRADAVYVILNDPYWEVVNSAPVRPLNYDYLKELAPAAQRFYEIVSFRIFAALKNGRAIARLSYSDYCAFSAQQRYYDYEHFRVQMYKVHKPHLQSGYLSAVRCEPATDGEGKPDWTMVYTLGRKAKAEFDTFSRRHRELPGSPAVGTGTGDTAPPLLEALTRRGIAEARARRLLASLHPEQPVEDQLEWGDYLIRSAPGGKFANPPGLYVSLIRDNIVPPPSFPASRRRKLRETEPPANPGERLPEAQRRLLYEEYVERQAAAHFERRQADSAVQERIAAHRKDYARQFPKLSPETLTEMANRAVQAELAAEIGIPPFEEFPAYGPDGLYGPPGPNGPNGPKVPKGPNV